MKLKPAVIEPEYTIYYKRISTLPLIVIKCWLLKFKMMRKVFKVQLIAGKAGVGEVRYKIRPIFYIRRALDDEN